MHFLSNISYGMYVCAIGNFYKLRQASTRAKCVNNYVGGSSLSANWIIKDHQLLIQFYLLLSLKQNIARDKIGEYIGQFIFLFLVKERLIQEK
jgi:hypothetical protein